MVKQDLIEHLTHNCGLYRSSAIAAVNGAIDFIASAVKSGEDVTLRGLGSFRVKSTPGKMGRDIQANAPVFIPPHKVVKFIPAKNIRDILMQDPGEMPSGK